MKSEPPPCPNTTTNGSTSANDGAFRTQPSREPTWTTPARGGDCVQTKCGAALSACGAHKDTGGKPIDAVPPASAPPATLVGKWQSYYAPNAQMENWTFNADGTAAHSMKA